MNSIQITRLETKQYMTYVKKYNMEKKLATYTEPGIRLQLIKIYQENVEFDYVTQKNITVERPKNYQIRKNRKRLATFRWETPAKQKFNALIQQELLQTKMDL